MGSPRNQIQLDPPEGAGDGLLIQIDHGNMVAEAVSVSDPPEDGSNGGGGKMVNGTALTNVMDSIDEDHGESPVIETGGDSDTMEDGKKGGSDLME